MPFPSSNRTGRARPPIEERVPSLKAGRAVPNLRALARPEFDGTGGTRRQGRGRPNKKKVTVDQQTLPPVPRSTVQKRRATIFVPKFTLAVPGG